jgi:hypothetical protein
VLVQRRTAAIWVIPSTADGARVVAVIASESAGPAQPDPETLIGRRVASDAGPIAYGTPEK